LVVLGEHTKPNSDEYRRACSHFRLWRINSPLHPYKETLITAFIVAGIRLPILTPQTPHAIGSPRAFLLGKRSLHRFCNAAADGFTRRFYPPLLWKVNAAVMFWKASKAERCESGDENFGVGPYRGVWGSSCRLAKLSYNCEYGDQRGLRRAAGHHAASPRPVADDSPHLPEAEASTASLRRCRKGERN
jgi:hypothetical protein